MNICQVAYSRYPDDPRVRREAEALQSAGYQVHIVAAQGEGEKREELVREVHVHRIPLPIVKGGRVRYFFQYALFFALASCALVVLHLRFKFAVINVKSLPDFQVFCALPEKVAGAKVVLDLHEAMPEILAARFSRPRDALLVQLARLAERVSCGFADWVVVPAVIRRDLLISRGLDPRKITVLTNAPDEVFLNGPSDAINEADASLQDHWIIVHAGGINEERDLVTLIDAGRILSTAHPTSVLFFGRGDDRYRELLERRASPPTGDFEVRFGGWIKPPLVRRYLDLSTVGVVTYRRNPITELAAPNRVLEYAAVRKPLVLADVRGLRLVWKDAALFYEPGNPLDLAAKMKTLLDDPKLAARLVANAQRVYQSEDWAHSRDTLLSLYRTLLGNRA